MRNIFIVGLSLACIACTSPGLATECAPVIWDLENINYNPDGTSSSGTATSTRYCIADGAVQMDEFRSLDETGQTNFWSVSFHSADTEEGTSHTLWIMVGDPGYTIIPVTVNADGSRISGGSGADATGEFLERAQTTFSEDGSYLFEMGRSFDDGKTWIDPINVINAAMTDRAVPALPEALAPPMQEGADALPDDFPRGAPILDGTAEISTFERDGQLILQFASRYWEPNRWRLAEWVVGTDQVTFTEAEFD